MDTDALLLSLILAVSTSAILLPVALFLAHRLSQEFVRARNIYLAVIMLPIVLPPTVLGYYFLQLFNPQNSLGSFWQALFDQPLLFSFEALLFAACIFNLPFMFQPVYLAFKSIPISVREAAWCSGLSTWQTFLKVELPLAWPGVLTAIVLTIAHTLGEFGVVLMVGGNIPGETRTLSIAIYDRVQMFDTAGAGTMSAVLLLFSFLTIAFIYFLDGRYARKHH